MTQHILSLSYGKDSLACLGAIEKLGWPLDRIIHAEVWATDTISADLPPMVEFKAKADEIIKARWGIEVEHLCATRNGEKLTYEKLFYHVPKRKNEKPNGGGTPGSPIREGLGATPSSKCGVCGFPFTVGSWCKKLKDGSYPRLSNAERELVYQRPQNPSFPVAPLHKGQIYILCSISVSLPMSRSGS